MAIAGISAPATAVKAESKSKPNVIIIYADDIGYGDLGVTGATGYATPNIDRLSFDGIRFTKFSFLNYINSLQ